MRNFAPVFALFVVFAVLVQRPDPAHARSPLGSNLGHAIHSCDSAALNTGIEIFGGAGNDKRLSTIVIFNSSTTPVYLYSGNGTAYTDGMPFCSDSSACISASMTLSVNPKIIYCAPASGAVNIRVLGMD